MCLDLFSGLGGFSAAFRDSDDWQVYTVDIDPEFDPDLCADVMELRPADVLDAIDLDRGEIDALVVLASPPCTVFSPAGNHDLWDFDSQQPTGEPAREHVTLAYHTIGLVRSLSPDYWFVENPTGRLKWYLGEPTGRVTYCQYGRDYMKRTDLWGDHPQMEYRSCTRNSECHERNVEDDGTSAVASMDRDHAERSKVPYELSESIRDACMAALGGETRIQATAEDYL